MIDGHWSAHKQVSPFTEPLCLKWANQHLCYELQGWICVSGPPPLSPEPASQPASHPRPNLLTVPSGGQIYTTVPTIQSPFHSTRRIIWRATAVCVHDHPPSSLTSVRENTSCVDYHGRPCYYHNSWDSDAFAEWIISKVLCAEIIAPCENWGCSPS